MALNRLIDARIDAANPRTAARELPTGALGVGRAWSASASRRSSSTSSRSGSSIRSCGWLVADPGRGVRRLPVPEAVHVALPPLARRRRRARAGRRVGGDHAASCRGRPGRSAARSRPGSRASTSSTRCSTSTSTASRGCTRGRPASASAEPSLGARALHLADRRAARRRRARPRRRRPLLGRRRARRRRCSSTSTRSSGRATCAGSTRRSSR